jgi:hypothetical protein
MVSTVCWFIALPKTLRDVGWRHALVDESVGYTEGSTNNGRDHVPRLSFNKGLF